MHVGVRRLGAMLAAPWALAMLLACGLGGPATTQVDVALTFAAPERVFVQKGDSLSLIAKREGCSVEDLSHELIAQLAKGTAHGTGFLSWFIETLMTAPQIEEVFASDDDIRQIFHEMR